MQELRHIRSPLFYWASILRGLCVTCASRVKQLNPSVPLKEEIISETQRHSSILSYLAWLSFL